METGPRKRTTTIFILNFLSLGLLILFGNEQGCPKKGQGERKGEISFIFQCLRKLWTWTTTEERFICTPIQWIWWACGQNSCISHLVFDTHHILDALHWHPNKLMIRSTGVTLIPLLFIYFFYGCAFMLMWIVTLEFPYLINQSQKAEVHFAGSLVIFVSSFHISE